MTSIAILRKARAIESACGKKLDRLPEATAGWARNCVYLAKRAQTAAEAGDRTHATMWLYELQAYLRETGHGAIASRR